MHFRGLARCGCAALWLLAGSLGCNLISAERGGPNVVLVTIDTLRADRVGVYGARDVATPTLDALPRILAEFATVGDALDYAAKGSRGLNFHDARGTLVRAYPYSELREDALLHARRLTSLGIAPGDRVALIAETGPEFAAAFFGAV